ncbi:MAG: trypsin-like peptidase domain-containing protein [Candidatus Dormibacteria bacterium]|jgi:S1-C subfamily serine protease
MSRWTWAAVPALLVMTGTLASCSSAASTGSPPKVAKISPIKISPSSLSQSLAVLQQAYVDLYKVVSPAVVQISTKADLGSGIIFNAQGDIVTNNHVADGYKSFEVTLADGKEYPGTLVNNFAPDDLAVIHINATGLQPATFGDSSELQVGDIVMAIGNPLGFQSSATEGIVSAIGRTVSEPNGVTLPDVIQTSAPINPGNSGGALVDLEGQVVGIPTLTALDEELGGSEAAGIGFAIPSSLVATIAGQIVKYGAVQTSGRACIGIEVEQVTGSNGEDDGVLVTSVTRATASSAGLKAQDVITAANGQATPAVEDLTDALANLSPGAKVTLAVTEPSGNKTTISLTLGQLSATSCA